MKRSCPALVSAHRHLPPTGPYGLTSAPFGLTRARRSVLAARRSALAARRSPLSARAAPEARGSKRKLCRRSDVCLGVRSPCEVGTYRRVVSPLRLAPSRRARGALPTDPALTGRFAFSCGGVPPLSLPRIRAKWRAVRCHSRSPSSLTCRFQIGHFEDYARSITFDKGLDFVRFCDLSRTSPTGFRAQDRLTGFGLTCHARRVRAHWRVSLASVGFVRITWRRATSDARRFVCARGRQRSRTLARSQEARRRRSPQTL
jgi:hypothetical protein